VTVKCIAKVNISKHKYDSDSSYGVQCNPSQLKNIIKAMPPVEKSACPDRTDWIKKVLEASKLEKKVTIVVIGCNKGDDFISQLGAWSDNTSYDPDRYVSTLQSKHQVSSFVCGRARKIAFNQKPRLITGYCIEPMPINFKLLTDMVNEMNFDTDDVRIHQLAMNAFPDISLFPNATQSGRENLGLSDGAIHPDSVYVNVTNIDSFLRIENLQMIDFLSIDTEGHDGKVILGMVKTLARGLIRVFEFEFDDNPPWKTMVTIYVFYLDIIDATIY
jgi:FkbM family methyltransferase